MPDQPARPRQSSPGRDPYASVGEHGYVPLEPAPTTKPEKPAEVTARDAELPETKSGISVCRGLRSELPAVLDGLTQIASMHLIVNPITLEEPLSVEFAQSDYLWNWLPPEAIHAVSPVVMSPAGNVRPEQLLAEVWGRNSAIALFTMTESATLLQSLIGVVRGDDGTSRDEPKGAVAFYIPAVTRAMLTNPNDTILSPLFDFVDGVLCESQNSESWEFYCTPQLRAAGNLPAGRFSER